MSDQSAGACAAPHPDRLRCRASAQHAALAPLRLAGPGADTTHALRPIDQTGLSRQVMRIGRRGSLALIGAVLLAGCGIGTDEESKVNFGGLEAAVETASPRVTGVESVERDADGLGHTISVRLVFDSSIAATAAELDAIAKAIWSSSPWKPNGIDLVATGGSADGEKVDLRTAADALTPILFRPFGQGGVSLLGMQKRYGEWRKP